MERRQAAALGSTPEKQKTPDAIVGNMVGSIYRFMQTAKLYSFIHLYLFEKNGIKNHGAFSY